MLTKIHKTIQTSELRKNLSLHLKKTKDEPVMISINRGEQTCVIIDSDLYNALIEAYEDSVVSQALKCLVNEDKKEYISLNALKKKYDV